MLTGFNARRALEIIYDFIKKFVHVRPIVVPELDNLFLPSREVVFMVELVVIRGFVRINIHMGTTLIVSKPNHPTEKKLTDYLGISREVREQRLSGLLSQLAPFAIGEVAPLVNGQREDKGRYATVSEILLPENGSQKIFLILLPTLKYQ